MWKFLERYFTFTTGEKNGILALIFLIVAVSVAPSIYFYFKPVPHTDNSQYKAEIDSFARACDEPAPSLAASTPEDSAIAKVQPDSLTHRSWKKPETFEFDPNTIGVTEWVRLGFSERQALSIEKYKSKGGTFRKPEDLKKLYVMSDENYERIYPYVQIHKPVKRRVE